MFTKVLQRSSVWVRPGLRSYLSTTVVTSSKRVLARTVAIKRQDYYTKRVYVGGIIGIAAIAAIVGTSLKDIVFNDEDLADDALNSVTIDSSISPFPNNIDPKSYQVETNYSLLGFGMRAVTFLKFKIYALGIYISEDDKHLISEIFSTKYLSTTFIDTYSTNNHKENFYEALNDPKKSLILIGNLLDSGIRMLAKVTPVRNTDFNHLRDGITITVMNHPDAAGKSEELKNGLNQLKDALSNKGSVSKNDDLLIELQSSGTLRFTHHNRKKDKFVLLGTVSDPIIGKFLFGQYIGGPRPLSQATKESVTTKLVSMV